MVLYAKVLTRAEDSDDTLSPTKSAILENNADVVI
jgi:hypothetical protein